MPSRTIICQLQEQDISDRIGNIISETAPDDYIWVFGSRQKAAAAITALSRLDNNVYSKRFIYTCVEINDDDNDDDDGNNAAATKHRQAARQKRTVLGAMVGYTQSERVDSYWDYVRALGLWCGTLVFLRLLFVLATNEWPSQRRLGYDHFYIQDIAVHPDARGRGVGSKIINFAKARFMHHPEKGVRSLTLDVAHDNGSARRLYERLGFRPQLSLKDQLHKALNIPQHWTCMELLLTSAVVGEPPSKTAQHQAAA